MTFTGWSLLQMATLFGVGASVITALYLLKMRRRQVVVPFAALWEQVARESESRRLWRKLRRMISWLVQLILLALLCLALGNPKPESWVRDPQTLALVIDGSASMDGLVADRSRTRLAAALDRARAEIGAMGATDRTVIIVAGADVSVVGPLDDDPEALLPALNSIRTMPGEADFGAALSLARHAVARQAGPRILVLTDGAIAPAGVRALEVCVTGDLPCQVSVRGGPADNLALTAFAARRYGHDREHVEVLAEVRNFGAQKAAVILDIEADGVAVGRQVLQVEPGARVREILSDVDAARTRLVARLRPDPDTPEQGHLGPAHDDVAFAVVPPLRPFEVTLVSAGDNLFLEAALLTLEENVRLTAITPQEAVDGTPALDEADLVIFDVHDHPLPDTLPTGNIVLFDPWRSDDGPTPIALDRRVSRPFLTEQAQNHPILENIVLKDVNIARGTTFQTEPGDQVLVRSLGAPIVALREGRQNLLVVGFDLRESDFPLRTAFPLFIHNIVRHFEQQQDGFVASLPVGLTREVALAEIGLPGEEVTRVAIRGPSGEDTEIPVDHGTVRIHATYPGFYEIRSLDGTTPDSTVDIAVNQADVAASTLDDRVSGVPEINAATAGAAPGPAPVGTGPLWMTLLLIACGLVAGEWITYHRRITV